MYLLYKQCLTVWPRCKTLLDKLDDCFSYVFEELQKHFVLVSSKKCFTGSVLLCGQTLKHCVLQANLKSLTKNVWSFGQGIRKNSTIFDLRLRSLFSFHHRNIFQHAPKLFSSDTQFFPQWINVRNRLNKCLNFSHRYNLKDNVRQSFYDEATKWIKAVGKKRKFMGGNQPNLADLVISKFFYVS